MSEEEIPTESYREKPSDLPYKVTKWIDVWDRIKGDALRAVALGITLLSVVGMGKCSMKCHDENTVERKRVYECEIACLPDRAHTRFDTCMCSKKASTVFDSDGPAYKPNMEKFSVPK